MSKATLLLIAAIALTIACNRESSRSRRGAKQAVAEPAMELNETNFDREVTNAFQPPLVLFGNEGSAASKDMLSVMEDLAVEFKGRLKVGKLNTSKGAKITEFYQAYSTPIIILINGQNGEVERFRGVKTRDEIAKRLNQLMGPALPPKK